MKKIEVFKTGTHRAMDGTEVNYGDTQLRLTAAAYDPAHYKAPVCIGHPAVDAPAYGWVEGLEFAGGTLSAYVSDIDPDFAEAVRAGRYRNVSASFWRPEAPTNPKAGILSLRHVGFLGAVPPAVKGLKTVSFSEAAEDVLDFPGNDAPLADAEGGTLDFVGRRTVRKRTAKPLSEREADLAAREATLARREVSDFCDALVSQGRLLPALRGMAETLLHAASDAETLTFADGEEPMPVRAGLMQFLRVSPKVVEFGEVAAPELDGPASSGQGYTPPAGFRVDAGRAALLKRTEAIMERDGVSFAEAARRAEAGA